MAKETVNKILQTKLAMSERAFRTGETTRLSILDAVRAINAAVKTPAERRAISGDRVVECRGYKDADDVLGIYLVGYVPDEEVGIVPHTKDELSLLKPPANADFLDGELMALISNEAIIVCRLGLFESALNSYVKGLAAKAGLDSEDALFLFKNRTDIDKLKLIQDDGVASIRFEGVANSASVEDASPGPSSLVAKFVASVREDLRALTYTDKTDRREAENLKVEVFLKFDKRSGTTIDQEEISDLAETIADADDGFEIITLNGRKIKPNDVLLNKNISLKKYGKSVAFDDVFSEMLVYHKELTKPSEADHE